MAFPFCVFYYSYFIELCLILERGCSRQDENNVCALECPLECALLLRRRDQPPSAFTGESSVTHMRNAFYRNITEDMQKYTIWPICGQLPITQMCLLNKSMAFNPPFAVIITYDVFSVFWRTIIGHSYT